MRIDLHTHSDRSDGTDHPRDLVAYAHTVGIDVLAITDHDTTVGWADALQAAAGAGIGLVPGIEISCEHRGMGMHLLAYLPDPTYEPLRAELRRVLDGRASRLPATLELLRDLGIDITPADVHAAAGPAEATGRPHVADAMIAKGIVANRDQAFARYLSAGRPAYVQRYAADLVSMIGVVADAGGVTVLAHPWARRGPSAVDSDALAALRDHGLIGLEADHQGHDPQMRAALHGIAADLGLIATGSSDYHGSGKLDCNLGCNTTAPDQFDRLLDAARAAAAKAGRGAEAAL
ncbi:MAG TPA: PHP domain-containing protein [Nocardioidaceae bacterium]|nr:PHP domain-containing protein [Nocardioidaceae bacterium]